MLIGVLVGVWIGGSVSEFIFKKLMAFIIIGCVAILFYLESKKSTTIPNNRLVANATGFLAGFATMIGNLAGPIVNVYFLAMRFPKNEFIGTAAWLYFIVNLFKLPFHFFVWETVTTRTLMLNLALVPAVLLGFFVGVAIVKLISNLNYRRFVLIATVIGGIILLFRP